MSIVALGGVAASAARVAVPAWGAGYADVSLTEPAELSGAQTLVIADIEVKCTVLSGGAADGRAGYRVVFGAGGWGRVIPAKGYRNDIGVAVSTVLGDAAAAVGETLAGAPSTRLGPHYARAEGQAADVLNALAARNWYVDFAGVTNIGQRPAAAYPGAAPRTRRDPAAGVFELAIESSLAGLVPGVTIDGSQPATDVEYELSGQRLTVRVYTGPSLSRRLLAYARILAALDPNHAYRVPREYRVTTQTGERLNLQPARVGSGMPALSGVPVRPGVAGMRASVKLGELVIVLFIDGDPSRPAVTSHDAADAPGFMPAEIDIGESPRLGVARLTDTVQAGAFAGVITGASARVKAAL
jgi:hypothetical protein